jgi:hypothetical protein
MLTFDEAAHEYRWDGNVVPNVTRVIGHLTDYSHIPPEKLEAARLQGQHVHKMADLHFKNDLKSVPEWMKGHHAALLRFVEETGFHCEGSERRMYHRLLRYAGTLDLEGYFTNLKGSKHRAIIDVKRSFFAGPAIGLQTVGYLDARNNEEGSSNFFRERYALQLNPNGTYRLISYHDKPEHKEDGIAFLACLQQLRWREKHYGR